MTPTKQCVTANVLQLAWYMSAPDVQEQHRAAYQAHRETCPACRARMSADTEWAKQAQHPELEGD